MLIWLQDNPFSTWIRESDWAIFALLITHTLGMAFLTGTGMVLNLRVLGVGARMPLTLVARFLPIMWCGLFTAIGSGILLVLGYPAKALTNPLFYIKLAVLTAALMLTKTLAKWLFDSRATNDVCTQDRAIALLCLVLWLVGITAGKFLAYTNTVLLIYG